MSFFEFPHTRTYDSDLGWLIKTVKELRDKYSETVTGGSNVIFFDSVADMKASETLGAGMYAVTAGYYTPNDGGHALYYITDAAPTTYYETLTGLYAVLIGEAGVNLKQFGARGDASTDDTQAFTYFMAYETKNKYIPSGRYVVNASFTIDTDNINIYGDKYGSSIIYNGTDYLFTVDAQHVTLEKFRIMAYNGAAINYVGSVRHGFLRLNELTIYAGGAYAVRIAVEGGYDTIENCTFYGSDQINAATSFIFLDGDTTSGGAVGLNYITIRGNSFDGGGITSQTVGVRITGGNVVDIVDNDFANLNAFGILIAGGAHLINAIDIRTNKFWNVAQGVYLTRRPNLANTLVDLITITGNIVNCINAFLNVASDTLSIKGLAIKDSRIIFGALTVNSFVFYRVYNTESFVIGDNTIDQVNGYNKILTNMCVIDANTTIAGQSGAYHVMAFNAAAGDGSVTVDMKNYGKPSTLIVPVLYVNHVASDSVRLKDYSYDSGTGILTINYTNSAQYVRPCKLLVF